MNCVNHFLAYNIDDLEPDYQLCTKSYNPQFAQNPIIFVNQIGGRQQNMIYTVLIVIFFVWF